jgi:hypothetical protein
MIACRKYRFLLLSFSTLSLILQPRFSNAQATAIRPSNETSQVSASPAFLGINEINAKAARHFANHFKPDSREKWVIIDGFYIASFTQATVRTQAFYTSRGGFAYTIKYYTAELLNDDIKTTILKKFKDHFIDVVTEISVLTDQIYYIKIKNSSNIKMIKYAQNVIEVTEDFGNVGS